MNNELREKEISRDYYLKRAIIFSLITAIGTPYARFIGGMIGVAVKEDARLSSDIDEVTTACFFWCFGNAVSLVIWLIFVGLSIYYTTKFWKAYKSCQELAHPSLTPETATESREREREI